VGRRDGGKPCGKSSSSRRWPISLHPLLVFVEHLPPGAGSTLPRPAIIVPPGDRRPPLTPFRRLHISQGRCTIHLAPACLHLDTAQRIWVRTAQCACSGRRIEPPSARRDSRGRGPRGPTKVALRWDEEAALSDLQLGCRRCALEVQGENGHVELYA